MRELLPFVLLACACGAAVSATVPAPAVSSDSASTAAAAAPSPSPPETYDDLVALAPSLSPGMREMGRKTSSDQPVELLRADGGDTCVRVAFAAASPVVARLVDEGGEVLATAGPATQGALGNRGPVCVRRGDAIRGTAESPVRPRVRWVVWQAP